ncbi:hypothetical protein M9435_006404 [Picochlorum sp. BPE23]|nr:hypothetical protein M9435_006404 [Picochlorum sp. BPE23]
MRSELEEEAQYLIDELDREEPCLVDNASAETSPRSTQTHLLYIKGSVAVVPSASTSIMGKVSIVKFEEEHDDNNTLHDCSRTFVAWFPDSTQPTMTQNATVQQHRVQGRGGKGCTGHHDPLHNDVLKKETYAIHPISVADMKAIRAWTPPFRTHSVTIVLHSGETVPTLFFKQGGVKAFLKALCTVVNLVASQDDPWTLLVHHMGDPYTLGIMSIHADAPHDALWRNAHLEMIQSRMQSNQSHESDESEAAPPITAARVKDHMTDIVDALQKFSMDAKKSVSSFLSGSFSQDMNSLLLPDDHDGSAAHANNVSGTTKEKTNNHDDDDDSGVNVPASAEWSISPSLSWEVVEKRHIKHASSPSRRQSHAPFSEDELRCCLDTHGTLTASGEKTMRYRVFYGGADPSVRLQVWRYFLCIDSINSTQQERQDAIQHRLKRYKMLKLQWKLMSPEQTSRFRKWRDRCRQVEKDITRTDRSHPLFASEHGDGIQVLRNILLSHVMWNWDLGYCQGMSDMVTPFIHVALNSGGDGSNHLTDEVESEAFWAFAALMEKIGGNFSIDGSSMQTQLETLQKLLKHLDPPLYDFLCQQHASNMFFCFRWLLVLFKREFPFDQVLKLWDCLYARPQDNLHIFMCLAILIRHRDDILERSLNFDGLMEYCIALQGSIPLDTTLIDAENLLQASIDAHIV